MKNVLKPLAQSVLMPLRLTAAATADASIHKKILSSRMTTLIISNKEIGYITKIIKSLEESFFLTKFNIRVTFAIKCQVRNPQLKTETKKIVKSDSYNSHYKAKTIRTIDKTYLEIEHI